MRSRFAPGQTLIALSHTHAAGLMSRSRADLPGGDLIGPVPRQRRRSTRPTGRRSDSSTASRRRSSMAKAAATWRLIAIASMPKRKSSSAASIQTGRPTTRCWSARSQPTTAELDRHAGQLRLPSDDARLAEHAHQPRLRRRAARNGRSRVPCAVPLPARSVGRPRPARGLRRRHGRRRSQRPATRLCGAGGARSAAAGRNAVRLCRARWSAARRSAPGGMSQRVRPPCSAISSGARLHLNLPLDYRPELATKEQTQADLTLWQAEEQKANAAGDTLAARDAHAHVERMTRQLWRLGACRRANSRSA